jgi:RNA polymerase sigma factor (sigma-70 family)
MISDDMALVREYAQSNSEQAFATLVSRHVNLVYSVALRQVRDPHLAEEITQSVFIILAGKAKSLSPKTILSGWLCRTARYVSANTLSIQRRRQFREQEAHMESILNEPEPGVWNQIAPLLDEALNYLGEKEHDAVVLRFFDGKELKQVGAAMGTTEDAARMRVNRGVEKLREFFTKKGVTLSATAIAGAVAANSVQAAPAGLAVAITAAAVSGTTITTTAVIAATKITAMTTLQKALFTAALAVVAGAGIYEAHQVLQLREQNQALQQKQASLAGQIEQLQQERDDAIGQLAALRKANEGQNSNAEELLRLRGEVAQLRRVAAQKGNAPIEDTAATARRESDAKGSKVEELNINLPKASWAFVGYGTPEAALQTLMWARREGDFKSLLASLTRGFVENGQKAWGDKFEDELTSEFPGKLAAVSDCTIVNKEVISDSEVRLVYRVAEQEGFGDDVRNKATTSTIMAKRFGDEWKLAP